MKTLLITLASVITILCLSNPNATEFGLYTDISVSTTDFENEMQLKGNESDYLPIPRLHGKKTNYFLFSVFELKIPNLNSETDYLSYSTKEYVGILNNFYLLE